MAISTILQLSRIINNICEFAFSVPLSEINLSEVVLKYIGSFRFSVRDLSPKVAEEHLGHMGLAKDC